MTCTIRIALCVDILGIDGPITPVEMADISRWPSFWERRSFHLSFH